jgi:Fe-S oxidoreductase
LEKIRKNKWLIKLVVKANLSTKSKLVENLLSAEKKYLPKDKTEANAKNVLKCALCPNMCRFDCPVLKAEKSEALSPSGKTRVAHLLETGKLGYRKETVNIFYRDVDCDACKQWCPFGFSVGDLSIGVKRDIAKRGQAPPALVAIKEKIVEQHTIYPERITSLDLNLKKTKADVLFFAGCTTLNKRKENAVATTKILEAAGVDFAVLEEEWCCGYPLHALGFQKEFQAFAERNLRAIRETGCKTVVCSCPSCAYMLKKIYPSGKFEVKHSSEFFWELIKSNKLSLNSVEGEFVFHDPCVLSRKLEVCEEPRQILKSIPKIVIKEAYSNRKKTQCCGRGGGLGIADPELSLQIAKNRVQQLKEASTAVVTACPSCELALKEADQTVEIVDLSEIILAALKNEGRKAREES